MFLSKDREIVLVKFFGDFWKGKEKDKVCMVINLNVNVFFNFIKYIRVSVDWNVFFWLDGVYSFNIIGWFFYL